MIAVWAYLGPSPAPLLPRWEPLIRPDSLRDIGVSVIPCNWLQIMENSLDPVHVEWLHQDFANYVQEQLDRPQDRVVMAHKRIGFDPFQHGIVEEKGRVHWRCVTSARPAAPWRPGGRQCQSLR
jgi:5,5'-dehydrodivanillate O-demethylase